MPLFSFINRGLGWIELLFTNIWALSRNEYLYLGL
jgi:hypothetical protein